MRQGKGNKQAQLLLSGTTGTIDARSRAGQKPNSRLTIQEFNPFFGKTQNTYSLRRFLNLPTIYVY